MAPPPTLRDAMSPSAPPPGDVPGDVVEDLMARYLEIVEGLISAYRRSLMDNVPGVIFALRRITKTGGQPETLVPAVPSMPEPRSSSDPQHGAMIAEALETAITNALEQDEMGMAALRNLWELGFDVTPLLITEDRPTIPPAMPRLIQIVIGADEAAVTATARAFSEATR